MDNKIFRKKSIDSINSPEELDSFLRVTKAPVWILLVAIILLLASVIVWANVGTLDTKVNAIAVSSICYIKEADVSSVKEGSKVIVNGDSYHVASISSDAVNARDVFSDYAMSLGGFENGDLVFMATLDRSAPVGTHLAQVVIESITPIRFILDSTN